MRTNPTVIAYTKGYCPYCKRAKALLRSKGVTFTEFDITDRPKLRAEMIAASGATTVPQIFIGQRHVGGSTELLAAEANGQLDRWLAAENIAVSEVV